MIILIHGTGLAAISQKLSELKKGFEPLATQVFSGKQIDFDQALMQFSNGDLFAEKRLVILEDYDPSEVDLERLQEDINIIVVIKFIKVIPANSALLKKAIELKV